MADVIILTQPDKGLPGRPERSQRRLRRRPDRALGPVGRRRGP